MISWEFIWLIKAVRVVYVLFLTSRLVDEDKISFRIPAVRIDGGGKIVINGTRAILME